MARMLEGLVVVMVVVALGRGGALAQEEDTDDIIVVGEQEKKVITTESSEGGVTIYINPEVKFEGIAVYANGTDAVTHAWFPAEDCFPAEDKWRQLYVMVKTSEDEEGLEAGFRTGKCFYKCKVSNTTGSLQSFSVEAHGAANFSVGNLPDDTEGVSFSKSTPIIFPTCKQLPSASGPSGSSVVVWVVLATLLVVGVAIVLVVLFIKKKQGPTYF